MADPPTNFLPGLVGRLPYSVRAAGIFDILRRCAVLMSCWKNAGGSRS
jgi:hypothetical protein